MQAFIISWEGQAENAREIAAALSSEVDALHVIYSNHSDRAEEGAGNWTQVPDDWFFGKKFSRSLDLFDGEVLLLIQADAHCDDWPQLVRRCRGAFSKKRVGVWGPGVDHTPHDYDFLQQKPSSKRELRHAINIDAIVVAYSHSVVERMRGFNYEDNNLGWGIDWAANCYSRVNSLHVLRDRSVEVSHPQGRGYDADEAMRQMESFLEQMNEQEKIQYTFLMTYRGVSIMQERKKRSAVQ